MPTGRSHRDPAIQNIPIRSEFGRALRKAFLEQQTPIHINVDYAELELRVMMQTIEKMKK